MFRSRQSRFTALPPFTAASVHSCSFLSLHHWPSLSLQSATLPSFVPDHSPAIPAGFRLLPSVRWHSSACFQVPPWAAMGLSTLVASLPPPAAPPPPAVLPAMPRTLRRCHSSARMPYHTAPSSAGGGLLAGIPQLRADPPPLRPHPPAPLSCVHTMPLASCLPLLCGECCAMPAEGPCSLSSRPPTFHLSDSTQLGKSSQKMRSANMKKKLVKP
mmetsp:Transcript_24145/g.75482  ORF Transcript_24145/g.75482 Transcript_24145/m.75482 type:complete len:215 (+) Transcript_24145:1399-2043(+)